MWLFYVFCRYSLAFGFIVAGIVKIIDERFASGLHTKHPMGHYLEALHQTGFYYWFIGYAQILAAIFLIIPRTATLGAIIYFPIIFNILILTYATRFDGSIFTAPLMTLANLYILGWNYEKWKDVLPFNSSENAFIEKDDAERRVRENIGWKAVFQKGISGTFKGIIAFIKALFGEKFPKLFAAGVFAAMILFVFIVPRMFTVKPRNELKYCLTQFKNTNRTQAGNIFCTCIHEKGDTLNNCLIEYENAADDISSAP